MRDGTRSITDPRLVRNALKRLSTFLRNLNDVVFSGEGFILQSLQGTRDGDTAFLKAYGTVVRKELGEGETLRISSGGLVAITSTIDYDV